MAQINKPNEYFNTKLYTGNGSTQAVTGVGFQPDWVWIKDRSVGYNHALFDSVRGTTKLLQSNTTNAEQTTSGVSSFDSDGFTLGSDIGMNQSSGSFASWNWLAGGTASSNTDGSITSSVSANTDSGFSIVSYTGGGSFGDTVGHNLGAVPAMIIVKTRNATSSWYTWHKGTGATDNQFMDFDTGALQTSGATIFDVSAMSSTTFTLGTNTDVNGSGSPKIAYCFAEKKGFSKFGSYTGNGSTDGTFVYTGFKPAFLLIKSSSVTGTTWFMFDNKRATYNIVNKELYAEDSQGEATVDRLDFCSNGFKCRNTSSSLNGSGSTYIYMAFAENPLVGTNNVPATAR